MNKNLIIAALMGLSGPAFADSLPLEQVQALAHNGTALVAVLGAPDRIDPVNVKGEVMATTWTYRGKTHDKHGNRSDVHIFLGTDGYAKAVSIEGRVTGIQVNGQDEYAGTEDVSDIPA